MTSSTIWEQIRYSASLRFFPSSFRLVGLSCVRLFVRPFVFYFISFFPSKLQGVYSCWFFARGEAEEILYFYSSWYYLKVYKHQQEHNGKARRTCNLNSWAKFFPGLHQINLIITSGVAKNFEEMASFRGLKACLHDNHFWHGSPKFCHAGQ